MHGSRGQGPGQVPGKGWGRGRGRGWIVAAVAIGVTPGVEAQDNTLILTTEANAAAGSGVLGGIEDEDILFYSPGIDGEPGLFFSDLQWESVIGDGDGDGTFDDEPSDVDALWVDPAFSGEMTIFDLWVSFTTDRSFASGTVARDGDVIKVRPDGGFRLMFDEGFFERMTSTSSIDVDAFAIEESGRVYFSFAENEVTTSPALIAQNGGDSILDGAVFVLEPAALEASILYFEQNIIDMVNSALGRSLTSIGDTQGLALDPDHPGELLFVVSSKTSGVEGTIFTTDLQGAVARINGIETAGTEFGFAEEETLNGLAVAGSLRTPLVLVIDDPDVSVSMQSEARVRVLQGRAGGAVQIVASPAVFPITPMIQESRLAGSGYLFVDPSTRLFRNTVHNPRFRVVLDAAGQGVLVLTTLGTAPGLARVLQAVDFSTREASHGIVVESVP